MANIRMVRVDYRLIHGQIVAKWIKFRPVDRLIIVDEELMKDPFMADIYKMAATGYEVDIVAAKDLKETLSKKNDNVMLIFKDVAGVYDTTKNYLDINEINVGAVPSNKDRVSIVQGVALSEEEYNKLEELEKDGINVFLQPIPENNAVKLASIKNKFN